MQHSLECVKMSFKVIITILHTQKLVNVLGKLFCLFEIPLKNAWKKYEKILENPGFLKL